MAISVGQDRDQDHVSIIKPSEFYTIVLSVIQELDGILSNLEDPIEVSVTLKRMARKHKYHKARKSWG